MKESDYLTLLHGVITHVQISAQLTFHKISFLLFILYYHALILPITPLIQCPEIYARPPSILGAMPPLVW